MAREKHITCFKADIAKKTITIYTNIEQTESEKSVIGLYLAQGFKAKFTERKQGKSVEDMRKELGNLENGEAKVAKFDQLYKEKSKDNNKSGVGFHNACKYYNAEMKASKSKEAVETKE